MKTEQLERYCTFLCHASSKSYASCFKVILISLLLFTTRVSAKLYGRKQGGTASIANLMVCRITIEGTIYPRGVADLYSYEETVCVPIVDETEDPTTYKIQLPEYISTRYRGEIRKGKLHLLITGATIHRNAIVTTASTRFSVMKGYKSHRLLQQHTMQNFTNTFGSKRYALVRISTTDSTPTYSLDHMVHRFTHAQEGMEAQYRDCSRQQLHFELSGAFDIQLPHDMNYYEANAGFVREAAMEQLISHYNIANFPSDVADHILWCIPPGTGSWVANAATGHWRSQYNDHWSMALSAIMHELAHNFGIGHSNQGGNVYADITGVMGSVLASETKPKKCFNADHHDQLGWYADQTLRYSPLSDSGKRFEIAAFVDWSRTKANNPVILKLDDRYYMQFNRATKYNEGTEQYQDKLVLVERMESSSDLLASLDVGETYSFFNYNGSRQTVQVKVCESNVENVFSPDYLVVGIGESTDPCVYDFFIPSHPPTQSPTTYPTNIPTSRPTSFPTQTPTTTPSTNPTNKPTHTPSVSPSTKPSVSPSNVPSFITSDFPVSIPSLLPSSFHSLSPTTLDHSNILNKTNIPTSRLPSKIPRTQPTKRLENPLDPVESEVPTPFPTAHNPSAPTSIRNHTIPTESPSREQKMAPSSSPSFFPVESPPRAATVGPTTTTSPSENFSTFPTPLLSNFPSLVEKQENDPTRAASKQPSAVPFDLPTLETTPSPSVSHSGPSHSPLQLPSKEPTRKPTIPPVNESSEPKKTLTQNWQFTPLFRHIIP